MFCEDIKKFDNGPELLNVSIRHIRLNSHILLNKKNRHVNSIYKVIDRRVRLFRRNVKVQAQWQIMT